jgi:hypothetical protein
MAAPQAAAAIPLATHRSDLRISRSRPSVQLRLTGMAEEHSVGLAGDIALRLLGVAFVGADIPVSRWLVASVHSRPAPLATLFELGLAASCFLLGCIGMALLVVGRHLFDRVEVPRRRWAYLSDEQTLSQLTAPSQAIRPRTTRPSGIEEPSHAEGSARPVTVFDGGFRR